MKVKTCSFLLVTYLFLVVFPFVALAQNGSVDVRIKRVEQGLLPGVLIKGEPAWSLEERMKHWKVPGLSIAVIKDFKVEWARSYGVKDIDTKEPVTAETLFQAGSISKPVAAMTALKRVQDGKIALDENINNKLVTWKLPDNEFMTNSTYSQPLPDDWRKKAASGHRGDGALVEGKIHVYPEMAAAGLWTTPADLAKFAIEVQLSYAGRSNKVLNKAMTEKMVTPFLEDAALGFFITKRGSNIYFGHDGADEGFRALLLVHRERGYGAVVMVNSDNGQIMGEVLRAVAREYNWDEYLPPVNEIISLDTTKLDEYTGRFQVNPDRILTIAREETKLVVRPTADVKFELLPVADGTFIRKEQNLKYTFVKGASGVNELQVTLPNGVIAKAPKVSADALIPFEHLSAGNIEKAMEAYRQLKKATPDNAAIAEARINGLGYGFLRQKKLPEAIAYFQLNAEFYPESWNVYDSLGDAYMANGDKELAIANFKKALEMNPKNTHGAEMLKKLTGQ